jgi:hypothetical protein
MGKKWTERRKIGKKRGEKEERSLLNLSYFSRETRKKRLVERREIRKKRWVERRERREKRWAERRKRRWAARRDGQYRRKSQEVRTLRGFADPSSPSRSGMPCHRSALYLDGEQCLDSTIKGMRCSM